MVLKKQQIFVFVYYIHFVNWCHQIVVIKIRVLTLTLMVIGSLTFCW